MTRLRREFLSTAGAGALLSACGASRGRDADEPRPRDDDDVGATEDLMREHGVIRRVLVVYREAAIRLRSRSAPVAPDALHRAADLMRTFGEEYHEKQLEEANIFPMLVKGNASMRAAVDTLVAQHERGREITGYIVAATSKPLDPEPLARVLESFARMYEMHAAIEDTIVFPAWKQLLSPKQLHEIGDRFEDIEHKTFGKDGFEDAVKRIQAIETSLAIDLAALTAPAPPV